MENQAPQIDESEQRAAKRLKVDDSTPQQTEEVAKPSEAQAAEERVAVDEATKRVEPVPAAGNGEKADVPMSEAPAVEKPAEGGPAQPKQDARDVRKGQAPIKAEFVSLRMFYRLTRLTCEIGFSFTGRVK